MSAGKLFLIGLCVSFLLSPALFGQDLPAAPEPEKKIKARIAAAEKSQIVLSEDGRTVIGIMEQKQEYKRLEIEIVDYEYEDVITVSGTGTPEYPARTTSSWF